MTKVECPGCERMVGLPSGLRFSGSGNNPDWSGVSCPWCYAEGSPTTIPAEKVQEAFTPEEYR